MSWLTGWQYRVPLTIDGTVPGLSASVSNAIAIVGVPATLKALCQAAGQDVRFTAADGTTLLSYGIEDWSAAAPVCHVLVPTVATGDTTIYAYGGNALASDAQDRAAVTVGYVMYLPMGESASPALDWTGNGNHGVAVGSPTFGVAGKTGKAISFGGDTVKGSLNCGTNAILYPSTAQTMLAWAKWGDIGSDDYIMAAWEFRWGVNGVGAFFHGEKNVRYYGTQVGSEWTHMAVVMDAPNAMTTAYRNGALSNGAFAAPLAGWGTTKPAVKIGTLNQLPGGYGFWKGEIDNAAIYSGVMPANSIAFVASSFPASTMFEFAALQAKPSGAAFHDFAGFGLSRRLDLSGARYT